MENNINMLENQNTLTTDGIETRSREASEIIAHMLLNRYIRDRDADRGLEQ